MWGIDVKPKILWQCTNFSVPIIIPLNIIDSDVLEYYCIVVIVYNYVHCFIRIYVNFISIYLEYEPNELIHFSLYKYDINFTKTTTIYNKYILNQFYW